MVSLCAYVITFVSSPCLSHQCGYHGYHSPASPAIAGSRPGALIAGTWAAMMYMGKDGYLQSCKEIIGAAKKLEGAIRNHLPELEILGEPMVSVVAFKARKGSQVNIYQLGDHLSSKGWHRAPVFLYCIYFWLTADLIGWISHYAVNALQNPPALHIACTRPTVPAIDGLIVDLKEGIEKVKNESSGSSGDMVTLYGTPAALCHSHCFLN